MKIAIATFVKTPEMTPVKTRLAATLGKEKTEKFYYKSLSATFSTLSQAKEKSSSDVSLFWAVAEKEGVTHPLWQLWPRLWQGDGDLGSRLATIYNQLKCEFDVVGLYGADSPHISSSRIGEAVRWIENNEASTVIGPSEDGGFYLFLSRDEIAAEIWQNVTYSQSETLAELKAKLATVKNIKLKELPTEFDIDTDVDYQRLVAMDSSFVLK